MVSNGRTRKSAHFLCDFCAGIEEVCLARVSLSDWLAFLARIRGVENPWLLRDRPADGSLCPGGGGLTIRAALRWS